MSKIKFRAWNEIDKLMVEWPTLKASPEFLGRLLTGKLKHFEPLQYTGAKDVNGIDIYEGDITEIETDDGKYTTAVYVDGGVLCIDVNGCDFDFTAIGWALGCNTNIESLRVIGNIYQNIELLTGDTK